jgi:carbon monoxide dehydrogenase subunit G
MKILIRTVQVITALVLIFFSIGMFIDEFQYETQTPVKAEPEYAFRVFSNPENAGKWLPGFVRFEQVKGEPMTEGSQWRLVMAQDGEEMVMLESVTQIRPGEQFSFVLENEVLQTWVDVYFEADKDHTLIRTVNKVKGKGLFWRSLLPLMKSAMKNQAEDSYRRLAELIEQQQ